MVGIGWLGFCQRTTQAFKIMEKHPCKNGSVQKKTIGGEPRNLAIFFWNTIEVHEFL